MLWWHLTWWRVLLSELKRLPRKGWETPQLNWRHFFQMTDKYDIYSETVLLTLLRHSAAYALMTTSVLMNLHHIYSMSLNISHTGLLSTMWARARDILLQMMPAYGLQVACRQMPVSWCNNISQVFRKLISTFAIVSIPLRMSALFLTGRILSLLPKKLEGKKISLVYNTGQILEITNVHLESTCN